MDIVLLADVGDHRNPYFRQNFRSVDLRFAQLRPGAGLTKLGYKRSQLHFQKWKIPFAPIMPPIFDHINEQPSILFGATGVGFALVPNRAFDRERNHRRDHAVIKFGGFPNLPRGGIGEVFPLTLCVSLLFSIRSQRLLILLFGRRIGVENVAFIFRI